MLLSMVRHTPLGVSRITNAAAMRSPCVDFSHCSASSHCRVAFNSVRIMPLRVIPRSVVIHPLSLVIMLQRWAARVYSGRPLPTSPDRLDPVSSVV
jgi:hypothetical protein